MRNFFAPGALWVKYGTMRDAFGPRAHPERCSEEWDTQEVLIPEAKYRVAMLRRLSLVAVMTGVVALQGLLLIGGGFLFLRWARVACWLTGCTR